MDNYRAQQEWNRLKFYFWRYFHFNFCRRNLKIAITSLLFGRFLSYWRTVLSVAPSLSPVNFKSLGEKLTTVRRCQIDGRHSVARIICVLQCCRLAGESLYGISIRSSCNIAASDHSVDHVGQHQKSRLPHG